MGNPKTDISVLICSRNRSANLADALHALERQQVRSGTAWEVVVVDNNSTDETKALVRDFTRKRDFLLRYVFEGRTGKSKALNEGLRQAQGEYILITDDDCIPNEYWVETALENFRSKRDVHLLGGRVELLNSDDKPVTLRTSTEQATLVLDDLGALFSFIAGCNMAVSKTAVSLLGGFDESLGPGGKIPAAEDIDYLYRGVKAGLTLHYFPDICVSHNHGRSTDAQVTDLNKSYTVGRGAFYCKHVLRGDTRVARLAYWEFTRLLAALLHDRRARVHIRNLMAGALRWIPQATKGRQSEGLSPTVKNDA